MFKLSIHIWVKKTAFHRTRVHNNSILTLYNQSSLEFEMIHNTHWKSLVVENEKENQGLKNRAKATLHNRDFFFRACAV